MYSRVSRRHLHITVALFTFAKRQKQLEYSSMGMWRAQCSGWYYLALQRKKILPHGAAWVNL